MQFYVNILNSVQTLRALLKSMIKNEEILIQVFDLVWKNI